MSGSRVTAAAQAVRADMQLAGSPNGSAPAPQPTPDSGWPVLHRDARHGLVGEILATLEPHTEADPVGILMSLLVAFGAMVGPGPHALADASRHPARLNAVLVGKTARARKGTATANARRIITAADATFSAERITSGLASGEGLIAAVRDPAGENADGEPADPGVTDKRLLVIEEEFARVLAVAAREGNTLSAILRQAWDSGDLHVLTRKDPLAASDAHISVLGHITVEELARRLSDTEVANGFANRFLFALVKRSRLLPSGGTPDPKKIVELGERLRKAATTARRRSVIKRTSDAENLWRNLYEGFPSHRGLLGAVTARPEAQTLRLSVAYALLDSDTVIREEHLRAAVAVWNYCEASAARLFGKSTGDPAADRLLTALRSAPEGLSRDAVRNLFSRHLTSDRLDQIISKLTADGSVTVAEEKTGGRPRQVLRAVSDESAESSQR